MLWTQDSLSLHALRFTFHVLRFTFYVSRFTFHVSRFTFYVLRVRGAAGFEGAGDAPGGDDEGAGGVLLQALEEAYHLARPLPVLGVVAEGSGMRAHIHAGILAQVPAVVHYPQVEVARRAAGKIGEDLVLLYYLDEGAIDVVVPVEHGLLPLDGPVSLDAHVPAVGRDVLQQHIVAAE